MPEKEPSPENGTAGVVGRARTFLAACAQYASARLRLASLEGREAAAGKAAGQELGEVGRREVGRREHLWWLFGVVCVLGGGRGGKYC